MYTIDKPLNHKIVIKKSIFICLILPFSNQDNFKEIMNDIKKNYKKAKHYCYAYKVGNHIRYSDDKEPHQTAGLKIYSNIEKYNLDNVLIVVIRYFGGVLLGKGPLGKAYYSVVDECLKQNINIKT